MPRRKTKRLPPKPGWAIYLRTSDEEAQNPALSQKRQRFAINTSLVDRSTMPLIEEYVDNLTGRSPERFDYQRMLEDARLGRFSHVAVERADRFGRNDAEALRAIDELHDFGVAVRFANQPDLDPIDADDRILVTLQFTLARRESILMGLRIQGGHHSKLRDGGWATLAPDGYRNMEERTEHSERLEYGKYKHWVEADPEQYKVWRCAWDLLLEDRLTLEEICEALHARGFRFRTGRPFVEFKEGRRITAANGLSKKFHNWFYAGWVVSEQANIPPKTIRGEWKPVVTTEEFERGLEILRRRVKDRSPRRRHEYLLTGLVYLQDEEPDRLVRLTCSTSNPERSSGGTAHYRVARQDIHFQCKLVDEQVAAHLRQIQVDPELVPIIRAAYTHEIAERLGHLRPSERARLEAELKAIDGEEARVARLLAAGKVTESVWNHLWEEWQDRRRIVRESLDGVSQQVDTHIAHLDQALTLISKVGVLFGAMERSTQKALLRDMVERVIVDRQGDVIQLVLLPPFSYLRQLTQHVRSSTRDAGKTKTSKKRSAGLSS
ncbi:MAG: recombinase family protein, partial [Anaerolinea sp.]|nr:recombinase family protein [Anaerolinea sp.]